MSTDYVTTRWWENYLVRYLMPSIAGVAIVSWLCTHGGEGLREILLLPANIKSISSASSLQPRIDATSLTLLFLYGNIFCYIASYPILVFHVTRVIDFSDGQWTANFRSDGYIAAIALVVVSFVLFHLPNAEWRFWMAYIIVGGMVVIQIRRLHIAMSRKIRNLPGLSAGTVRLAYGFAFTLAKRRGVLEVETTSLPKVNDSASPVEDDEDEIKNKRK